jgi:hypothetical protein
MDEYLDECLALQEAGEEGPTPAKLNRGGKSPSAASHSFKYMQGYIFSKLIKFELYLKLFFLLILHTLFRSAYRSPIKIVSPAASPRSNDQYVVEGDNCVPLMHSVSLYRKQQSQVYSYLLYIYYSIFKHSY